MLLSAEHIVVEFPAGRRQKVHAVSDVTFGLDEGDTLGLVGESGCGKSTLARAVMQLPPPTSGAVRVAGRELTALGGKALREARRDVQMVFQDPISSLNPRRRVFDLVAEPLAIAGVSDGRRHRVSAALEAVGLTTEVLDAYPHQLSGGQCQRVSIARAVVVEPKVVICDEPVSSLDVSVQAQILNLLEDMKDRYGVSMLFISHDLSVVKHISDRVAVMYLGKLCEVAPAEELYRAPMHPYTRALIASIPTSGGVASGDAATAGAAATGDLAALKGELPSALSPPSGCRFRTRCPLAQPRCATEEPLMHDEVPGHGVACHFPIR